MEEDYSPEDLLSKLKRSLNRDQDRALFGLPPNPPADADRSPMPASAALKGWRPARLPDGSWGSLYAGRNLKTLPLELVGLTITVRARSGKSWEATITEVVERSPDRLLVLTRRLDQCVLCQKRNMEELMQRILPEAGTQCPSITAGQWLEHDHDGEQLQCPYDLEDDEYLIPSMVRHFCHRLAIPPENFGLEIG